MAKTRTIKIRFMKLVCTYCSFAYERRWAEFNSSKVFSSSLLFFHAIPLFLEANVLPITFLYHEWVASLMYDINSNNAPINMLHLFKETSSVHSYNTRSSTSGNLYVQNSRLEIQRRSFSRVGVRLWNEIPCHMRVLPKNTFKKVLRTSLLNILQNEDD